MSEVGFGFVDDLLYQEPFLQSTRIWHNTVSTKLVATARNRDVGGFVVGVHTGIDACWDDSGVFIGQFLIIMDVVAEFLEHKREETGIINTEKEFDVWSLLGEGMKKRIKSMIDPYDVCSIGFFEGIDLF